MLRIIIAVAILVTGTSLVGGYSFSDSEFEATADSMPIPISELYLILGMNFLLAIFLSLFAIFLFAFVIYRNYKASRHSSLQPNLGGEQSHSVLVVASDDYRELISGEKIGIHQYEEWIASNHKALSEKRQQLSIANTNTTLLIISIFLVAALFVFIMDVAYIELIIIDICIILLAVLFIIILYWSRNESLSNWKTLLVTERQKADFPYLDTTEFEVACVLYFIMVLSAFFALSTFLSYLISQ